MLHRIVQISLEMHSHLTPCNVTLSEMTMIKTKAYVTNGKMEQCSCDDLGQSQASISTDVVIDMITLTMSNWLLL